jgi:hypothetical protein
MTDPIPTPTPNRDPWQLESPKSAKQLHVPCGNVGGYNLFKNKIFKYIRYCRRWSCPRCGKRKKNFYVGEFTEQFKEKTLYASEIDEKSWNTVRQKIHRAGGSYLKIKTVLKGAWTGKFIIISDRPVLTSQRLKYVKDFLESSIPNLTPTEVDINRTLTYSENWQPSKIKYDPPDKTIESFLPGIFANWIGHRLGLRIDPEYIEVKDDNNWDEWVSEMKRYEHEIENRITKKLTSDNLRDDKKYQKAISAECALIMKENQD